MSLALRRPAMFCLLVSITCTVYVGQLAGASHSYLETDLPGSAQAYLWHYPAMVGVLGCLVTWVINRVSPATRFFGFAAVFLCFAACAALLFIGSQHAAPVHFAVFKLVLVGTLVVLFLCGSAFGAWRSLQINKRD